MVAYLTDIWDNIKSVLSYITLIDIFDIIFLSVIMFFCIKLMRETRAEQLIKGIVFLSVLLFFLEQLQFKVMGIIAQTFFNIGLLAIIVMFQPELRRILERVGRTKMSKRIPFLEGVSDELNRKNTAAINSIAKACENLSRSMTGALIVIERQTKLGEQIETGTLINAVPSAELFGNIFVPNTPLHDGAVIMRDGLIHAAACYLPKPAKEELVPKELGTRHRAAIGISEVSDAIVIVVSEETGVISIAEDGKLTRNFSGVTLRKYLTEQLIKAAPENPKKPKKSASGKNKKQKETVKETVKK
ncbi:MAG: TIGR00159 family protein [Ruminococcaceae bacterium]|nr:TIGR00159 family protein [Oscillospiraceae bacterium]